MTKKCRSPWLAVIFNAGGLRLGGSQTNADCRATRHRFMRGSTSSFRYTARSITAGAQSETNVKCWTRPHFFAPRFLLPKRPNRQHNPCQNQSTMPRDDRLAAYFARQDARFAEPGIEISEIGGLAIYRCPRTSFYSQGIEFRGRKRQNGLQKKSLFLAK